MKVVKTVAELRQHIDAWKSQGEKIVLVPTMGNLHAGHLSLMKHARCCGDKVVCSIFVNALQFDRKEDLQVYPRTPKEDLLALQGENIDLVFMPEHQEVYSEEHKPEVNIPKHPINEELCGAYRAGFFDGIVEVVARLFHMVAPDVAVFGEKDYQQLTIIRLLVKDLSLPIQIESVATQREADGLAYSSRNSYLSTQERAKAEQIYSSLQDIKTQVEAGSRDFEILEKNAIEQLTVAGFRPDYVAIRDASNLQPVAYNTDLIVILVAAWLGSARLIDNVLLQMR